jgi:5-formyltetrahydrofolate cyclo-ligase
VFDTRTGLPSDLIENPGAGHTAGCASPPRAESLTGRLPAPPVAPVREQRFEPAHAGGVSSYPSVAAIHSRLTPQPHPDSGDSAPIRRQLRARRRAISAAERKRAGRKLARFVDSARWLRPGRRIGLYLAMAEEIDTSALLALARRRRCVIALPRVLSKRHSRMRFFEFDGTMTRGAYGILQPSGRRALRVRELDVVFMPLVGFDAAGNRMGMGKGFYDRCFAHRIRLRKWRRPLLVGIAYEVQQVPHLPHGRHDVPVDAIVTECAMRRIPGRHP